MTILTNGNKKLDKGCFIYSHTPITGCGAWCKDCAKTCYAKPLYDLRPAVRKKWDANLALSKRPDFYAKFCQELKDRSVKVVRLMQSGDFYNDAIINKFYRIMRDNPGVRFYGYTKNERAYKKLNMLPNCNIVFSYVKGYLNFGSKEYCNLLHKKFGTYICKLDEEAGEKCTRDCKVCLDKVASKNGVCFEIHGIHRKDLTYENAVMADLQALPDHTDRD